jgi:hypothetical protein
MAPARCDAGEWFCVNHIAESKEVEKHLEPLMRQAQPSDKRCVRLIRTASGHIRGLWTYDSHDSETPSVKRSHERIIFKNAKLNTSFLIGIVVGLLVPQAAAWCCWRLQRFMKTPRSTAFCPVEDLRRAAGMVC